MSSPEFVRILGRSKKILNAEERSDGVQGHFVIPNLFRDLFLDPDLRQDDKSPSSVFRPLSSTFQTPLPLPYALTK